MVDVALIKVKAGDGGDGLVSFRREKYVAKGGPDGGDGGRGGDVLLEGERNLRTLDYFAGREKFEAESGERGGKQKKTGGGGDELRIGIPLGTVVYEFDGDVDAIRSRKKLFAILRTSRSELGVVHKGGENKKRKAKSEERKGLELLGEITEGGERVVVAKGGKGGRGNDAFKSATNRTPREAEKGEKGEERWLVLELKLLADVGLVGLPNAGKSTLLSVLTAARPKIAGYEFTTLEPNLGVMTIKSKKPFDKLRTRQETRNKQISNSNYQKELVIADIPGLIEGASRGRGLGDEFLRHIERCKVLVHVVAITEEILRFSGDSHIARSTQHDKSALKSLADLSNETAELLWRDYETVRGELADYHPNLLKKKEIVVVSKIDLISREELDELKTEVRQYFSGKGVQNVLFVSGVTKEGLVELKERLVGIF